jgi:tyrosyl-tRNA synthetase
LLAKLELGRPLNVKLGVNPTTPDIHLGFITGLIKLRQFQDLGHRAILIIEDFTAMIGNLSDQSTASPQLSHDAVMANATMLKDEAFKILNPEQTRIVFNGEWFEMMTFERVINLNSYITLQQTLQHEDFKRRIAVNEPIRFHEIQYAVMQGWDSVMIQADVEIGRPEQLFNCLVGRYLQREHGQALQSVVILRMPERNNVELHKSCQHEITATFPHP